MRRITAAVAVLAVAVTGCRSAATKSNAAVGNQVLFAAPVGKGASQSVELAGVTWGLGEIGVVFAHTFRDTKESWAPFAEAMATRGFRTLVFDFRGYGDSNGERDPAKNDLDLEAAIDKIEALGARKVFVVGASMGGTAAIVVGARLRLAGIVAVSAPTDFMGLSAAAAIKSIDEPVLLIAAAGDAGAPEAARLLYAAAPQPKLLEIIPGTSAHGTDLLQGPPAARVSADIAQFLIDRR
jgi:pimeloyl-ACP methyl ester carboxylesterase